MFLLDIEITLCSWAIYITIHIYNNDAADWLTKKNAFFFKLIILEFMFLQFLFFVLKHLVLNQDMAYALLDGLSIP